MDLGRRRRERAERAEWERLVRGHPRFHVHFSVGQVAASLWDYGEDGLAARAVDLTDAELAAVQGIASWYEDPGYPLPVTGKRITHRHVTALSAVTFFEGAVRPLARTRRRPERDRPERYAPTPPDPSSGPPRRSG